MKPAIHPFALSIIGFAMIVWSTMAMPLFEWRIHQNTTIWWTWKAKLGESFDDGSYLIRRDFYIQDRRDCLQEDFIIRRTLREEKLEQLSLTINKSVPWLYGLSLIEIILSGIYILWFTIKRDNHLGLSVIIFPIILCWCLSNILIYSLKVSPTVGIPRYIGSVNCYPNGIPLVAELTHIFFAMPIILFAGLLFEARALGIMVKELTIAAPKSEEASFSTAG